MHSDIINGLLGFLESPGSSADAFYSAHPPQIGFGAEGEVLNKVFEAMALLQLVQMFFYNFTKYCLAIAAAADRFHEQREPA
jgi:hypothetical protein